VLDRYTYSLNNPNAYTDPDGHFGFLIPLLAGAIIGGAIFTSGYLAAAGPNATVAGAVGAFTGSAVAGAVSVIATPLAGIILHAAGVSAAGTAHMVGPAQVNSAGGALFNLAEGYTQNIVNVAQGKNPTFTTNGGDVLASAALGCALSLGVCRAL
jgi:hypothetical protein